MQLSLPSPVCCRRIPGRVAPTLSSGATNLQRECRNSCAGFGSTATGTFSDHARLVSSTCSSLENHRRDSLHLHKSPKSPTHNDWRHCTCHPNSRADFQTQQDDCRGRVESCTGRNDGSQKYRSTVYLPAYSLAHFGRWGGSWPNGKVAKLAGIVLSSSLATTEWLKSFCLALDKILELIREDIATIKPHRHIIDSVGFLH